MSGRLRLCLASLLATVALAASACAPSVRFHTQVNRQRAAGDHEGAIRIFQENLKNYGKGDRLLALYEEATLLYYAKKFPEALKVLEQADRLGEELYTVSVTRTISTGIINDTMSEYGGEDFERVMVNILKALIYAEQGETDSALVEARKVDEKLALYNTKYDEGKNVYVEDAFGRFISGLLYYHSGASEDLQDANVAFRKAFEIYANDYQKNYRLGPPGQLKTAAAEAAMVSGDPPPPGADEIIVDFNPKDYGEVVVVHLNGLVPEKVEKYWVVPTPDGQIIKIAYPEYRKRRYAVKSSVVRATPVEGSVLAELPRTVMSASTEEAQPVGDIAVKNLDDRLGRIKAKAVARALAKYAATVATKQALRGKNNENALMAELVGLGMNVLSVATENADTRYWGFLPDQIRLARLRLAPGRYQLTAQLSIGKSISLGEVEVEAGKARLVSFSTSE